jgi:transcription initiation factor TFIID subunit 8
MLNSRRSQPTPLDFKYALAEFDLPMSSLEPHLNPPIPGEKLLVQLEPLPTEEIPAAPELLASLLGGELSGEPDKLSKSHIPNRFPSFPSKHTYKWTEKESARETDPRKIREEAAKAARQGEEALRRLTKVAKAGKEKDVKNAASKDPKSKQRYQLWEKTMEDLLNGQGYLNTRGKNASEEDDRGLIVNSERLFYRKGAPARRRHTIEVRPSIEG